MNADQIRKELQGLAQIRAGLEADLEQVRKDQAATLKKADTSPEISMTEAASLSNVSRFTAYELLRRAP